MDSLDRDRINRVKDLGALVNREAFFKWEEEGVDLRPFSTIGIGGKAACVVSPIDKEEIQITLEYCDNKGIPYSIIGNGSNTVFGDLDVLIDLKKLNHFIEGDRIVSADQVKPRDGIIVAQSGVLLGRRCRAMIRNNKVRAGSEPSIKDSDSLIRNYGSTLAGVAYKHSLSGIENLVDIPGTVGGAVVRNAGVYLHWMGRIVEKAILISPEGEEEVLLREDLHRWWWSSKDGLKFAYRYSILQEEKYKNHVLYAVHIRLNPGDKDEIKEQVFQNWRNRREKHPNGPSVGSVFKLRGYNLNKVFLRNGGEGIKHLHADELIKQTLNSTNGSFGGIVVPREYPVFFINNGYATLDDFKKTIEYIHKKVKDSTGISLQVEANFLPYGIEPKLNVSN